MDKIKESYEDYLKAIFLISKTNKGGWVSNSEISDFLNVKPPSVTNMLYKLKAKEFIDWKPRKSFRLTQNGKNIAKQVIKNYKKLREFFFITLKLNNKELVDKLCCGIEHHITPEVFDALDDLNLEFR